MSVVDSRHCLPATVAFSSQLNDSNMLFNSLLHDLSTISFVSLWFLLCTDSKVIYNFKNWTSCYSLPVTLDSMVPIGALFYKLIIKHQSFYGSSSEAVPFCESYVLLLQYFMISWELSKVCLHMLLILPGLHRTLFPGKLVFTFKTQIQCHLFSDAYPSSAHPSSGRVKSSPCFSPEPFLHI